MLLYFYRISACMLLLNACTTTHESGRAIYLSDAPTVYSKPDGTAQVNTKVFHRMTLTNQQNGKTIRANVWMHRNTPEGVVVGIDKRSAEALGILYTGSAPVDISY